MQHCTPETKAAALSRNIPFLQESKNENNVSFMEKLWQSVKRHVKQPEATQQKSCDMTHQRPSTETVARSNAANAMRSDGVTAKRHYAANATQHDALTVRLEDVIRMLE